MCFKACLLARWSFEPDDCVRLAMKNLETILRMQYLNMNKLFLYKL